MCLQESRSRGLTERGKTCSECGWHHPPAWGPDGIKGGGGDCKLNAGVWAFALSLLPGPSTTHQDKQEPLKPSTERILLDPGCLQQGFLVTAARIMINTGQGPITRKHSKPLSFLLKGKLRLTDRRHFLLTSYLDSEV